MCRASNDKREPTFMTEIIRYFTQKRRFSSPLVRKDRDIDWGNSALCANAPPKVHSCCSLCGRCNQIIPGQTASTASHRLRLVNGCSAANQVVDVNHPTTGPFLYYVYESKTNQFHHSLCTPIGSFKRKPRRKV